MNFASFVQFPAKLFRTSVEPNRISRDHSETRGRPPELDPSYIHTLTDDSTSFESSKCQAAWKTLQRDMALVPSGSTKLESNALFRTATGQAGSQSAFVAAFYVDRFAVTNRDYQKFVESGAYDAIERWPKEVWQHLLQFVDQTGTAGPQQWSHGRPAKEKLDHPVVGVCWFEAMAYANWMGKRLPTAEQWQRACSWHTGQNGQPAALRYPWGNAFDSNKANTWSTGIGSTVPVDQFYNGCTPNGVHQLIGNTWEWVEMRFDSPWETRDQASGFAEVRGGAFDTYFESQTRCQFRSGLPLLSRNNNVGFRCCIPVSDLKNAPGSSNLT